MKKVLAIATIAIVLASCGSANSLVNSCPAYAKHPGATGGSCSR